MKGHALLPLTVGLAAELEFRDSSADNCSPIEKLELKICYKLNRKSPARTTADSEQKDVNLFVCQHRSKPLVSGILFSYRTKVYPS